MHGLANTVLRLRAGAGSVGWVSGLGMSATKHAMAALSTDARRIAASDGRSSVLTLPKDQLEGPPLVDAPDGAAEIESYTVTFNRDNAPEKSMLYLRLPDGRRSVANGEKDDALFRLLLDVEGVGVRGRVTPGKDKEPNVFRPA
jgi:acetyl-CoA C-acetyltransferase